MTRDEAEKLLDTIINESRRSVLAEDCGEDAVVDEANEIVEECKAKLLTALTTTDQPEEPGKYLLTVEAEVNPGGMFSICNSPWDDWYSIEHITGRWRKVEP